jgi:hypothetical protein
MKSLSPWNTNAAVCEPAFIKPTGIRQLAKAFGVNLLARIALGENTPNAVCLRNYWDHHHFQTKHMTQSKADQSASRSDEHMLGHGFYNKNSHAQGKANTYALPLIVEDINRIDLGQIGSEFRIADYGSAQGQNSLLSMKTAVAQIRTLAAKSGRATTPISITHSDLPGSYLRCCGAT